MAKGTAWKAPHANASTVQGRADMPMLEGQQVGRLCGGSKWGERPVQHSPDPRCHFLLFIYQNLLLLASFFSLPCGTEGKDADMGGGVLDAPV